MKSSTATQAADVRYRLAEIVADPAAAGTFPFDLNDRGQVVGSVQIVATARALIAVSED